MAFVKILSVALCLSAASAAPQHLVRTLAAAPTQHLVHAASPATVVRTASPQVVRTVAQPQFVQTVAAPTVVRTAAVAQPQLVHTVAHAPTVVRTAPAVSHVAHVVEEVEEAADASYNFGYSVSDIESGDSKTREESRDGDVVRGSYSVADPDGRVRVVEYTADAVNGFQATVTYDGQEGPVAIPFNQPQEQTVVAAAAPAQATIIAARTPQAVHALHNTGSATVVRTAQPQLVQTVATAPTVVRTAAVAQPSAVHALHNVRTIAQPQLVQTVAQPQLLRTVAQPAAVHALHNTGSATVVRTASPQVVRAIPAATTHLTHF